jgi:hypothetical protein
MWPFDDPQKIIEQCTDQVSQNEGTELDKFFELESCAVEQADQLDMAEQLVLDTRLQDGKRQIARGQYIRSMAMGNQKANQQAADAYNETTAANTPAPLAAGAETLDNALEGEFGEIPGTVVDGVASKYVPGYKLRKKMKKLKSKKGKTKKGGDGMAVSGNCDI